ncbi:hypothetical protein [Corynebacterium variabile]|uniref:hypothetical protein n=1 Tax=Corynebacterium variabile TaxID=1727 RepID=UPI003BB21297
MSEYTDRFPDYLPDSMVMSAKNSAHGLSGAKTDDGSWIVTDNKTFTVWITAQNMLDALLVWARETQAAGGSRSYDELDLADTVLNHPERTSDSQINDEMDYAIVIVQRAVEMIRGRDSREQRIDHIARILESRGIAATREITDADSINFPDVAQCAAMRVKIEGGKLDLVVAPVGAGAPLAAVGCDDDPWELPTLTWLHSMEELTDYIDTVLR